MMFNTNVGDMPIDIFGDYVSDCLGEEWSWEYFIPILNSYARYPFQILAFGDARINNRGHGSGNGANNSVGNGEGCVENNCDWHKKYGNGYGKF